MTMHDDQGQEGYYEEQGRGQNGAAGGAPGAAMVRRSSFDMEETSKRAELAVASAQAKTTAMVQARFVMAMKSPRDPMVVREDFLARCADLDFAEVAIYRRPQGKKKDEESGRWVENIIEGPSIRFVEGMIQCTPHMGIESSTLYDDEDKKVLLVSVVDYQRNTNASAELTIQKTIERRDLKKNQKPISVRTNAYGDPVYILPATDDDVRMKEARAVSMTVRQLGLRILPGGVVAEAKRKVYETLKNQDKGKDPQAVRRKLADTFAGIGVSASQIAEYFGGVNVSALTDDQVMELRVIWSALQNGDGRWSEFLEGSPWREEGEDSEKKPTAAAQRIQDQVREKLQKRQAPAAPAQPAPGQGTPGPQATQGGAGAPVQPQAAPVAPAGQTGGQGPAQPAGAAPVAPDAQTAGIATALALDVGAVHAVAQLLRGGKDLAYILRYKAKGLNLEESAVRAIAERLGPADTGARSPTAIAGALGVTVEAVQEVLKRGAATPNASDDEIAMGVVDAGHNVTGGQVGEIFARANG